MQPFTPEQITALAPDDASVKAAKGLVNPSKWVLLAHDEQAVWGHCQGSGKNPYQTAIDMQEPAFKCSCPSRKFPCKHGLALLYMLADHTDKFQAAVIPDWVAEWLEKRNKTATIKAEKAANTESSVDPVAQKKRHDARMKKAADGLADLQVWLNDIVRNGLIAWRGTAFERCHQMAKRMVDAQMPALAGQLQQLADTPVERQDVLLHRLSKLFLLSKSFEHFHMLPEAWQAEILARLGFPIAKETVLTHDAHHDIWQHIGTTKQEIDRGEAHTHWLYGTQTGQFAYVLDFVIRGAPSGLPSVLQQSAYVGELCFYSGVRSCRAVPKQWQLLDDAPPLPTGSLNITQAWQKAHEIYADNPLIVQQPMYIESVKLLRDGAHFALSDGESILPIHLTEPALIQILLHTQGEAFGVFLLFDFEYDATSILAVNHVSGSLKIVV